MIDTYAKLQTAIQDWLENDELATRAPDFIQFCEQKLNRQLRIRPMECITSTPTVQDQAHYPWPDDFKELRAVLYPVHGRFRLLEQKTLEQVLLEYPSPNVGADLPVAYCIEGQAIRLAPIPAVADVTFYMTYYRHLPYLSDSVSSNWWLTDATDALLYGSLLEAEPYLYDDPRIAIWKDRFMEAMRALSNEDAMATWGGSTKRMVGM